MANVVMSEGKEWVIRWIYSFIILGMWFAIINLLNLSDGLYATLFTFGLFMYLMNIFGDGMKSNIRLLYLKSIDCITFTAGTMNSYIKRHLERKVK